MTDVNHNLSHLAIEFRDLPSSLADFVDNLEGSVRTFQESFNSDQLSSLDSFVYAYENMREDVNELESRSQTLLNYLDGKREPSEPEDIDDIKRTGQSLIDSVELFAEQTENISSELLELGLEEQAEALHEVTTQLKQLPPPSEVRSWLILSG